GGGGVENRRAAPPVIGPSDAVVQMPIHDTAGLLRWEVRRAKPTKMHLVLHLARAALPPEPPAKKKRLGGLRPPHPHLASLPAVSCNRSRKVYIIPWHRQPSPIPRPPRVRCGGRRRSHRFDREILVCSGLGALFRKPAHKCMSWRSPG